MTDIRRRGFPSATEFQNEMLELDAPDDEVLEHRNDRAAEIELAWLRKQAGELREQLASIQARRTDGNTVFSSPHQWPRIVATLLTIFVLASVAKRL